MSLIPWRYVWPLMGAFWHIWHMTVSNTLPTIKTVRFDISDSYKVIKETSLISSNQNEIFYPNFSRRKSSWSISAFLARLCHITYNLSLKLPSIYRFRTSVQGISAQIAKRLDTEQDNLDHYEEYKKVSKPFRQEPILLKTKPSFWRTFFGATCVAYFC